MQSRVCRMVCRGHADVQLVHSSTLELESSDRLTVRGDCVACVSCQGLKGAEKCAAAKGLGKLFIVAFSPQPPYVAGAIVDGLLPGERPGGRFVVRRSCHRRGSLMVAASASAASLPRDLALLLSSPSTRCTALMVALGLDEEVDAVYESAGCVVEHPGNA